jgi:GNAT superfamily N-acetyltransferase
MAPAGYGPESVAASRLNPVLMTKGEYEIDDDQGRLDLDVVHGFITGSYWAEGVPHDVVARSVANSLNLGLYIGGSQVGLTRAVTDRATFAWVCDVFVLPAHRGRGLAHW